MSQKFEEMPGMKDYRAGKTVVSSSPGILTLETSSICNLRCLMCPHSVGGVVRPKHLDQSYAEMLAGYILAAHSVQLHGIGEPLASPSFWQALDRLSPECESMINSNFTLLTDDKIASLLGSNLKKITVSLDAATKETYRRIRRFDFEIPLRNIRTFIERRNGQKQIHPQVFINMTLMRENLDELRDFVALARTLGVDGVEVWHLNRWPKEEMAKFEFDFDDYNFSYEKQGLWNYPELSDRIIQEAVAYAAEINMPMTLDPNKDVFYGEDS